MFKMTDAGDALLAWLSCYAEAGVPGCFKSDDTENETGGMTMSSLLDGVALSALMNRVFAEDEDACEVRSLSDIASSIPRSDLLPNIIDGSTEHIVQITAAVLISIVESDTAHRDECVQNIMTLSEEHQAKLMEVIQNSMEQVDIGSDDDNENISCENDTETVLNMSPKHGSPDSRRSSFAATPSHLRRQVLERMSESAKSKRQSKSSCHRLSVGSSGGSSNGDTSPNSDKSVGFSVPGELDGRKQADLSSRAQRLSRENTALKEEIEWLNSQIEKEKAATEQAKKALAEDKEAHDDNVRKLSRQAADSEDVIRAEFEHTLRAKDTRIAELEEAENESTRLANTVQSLRDELAIAKGATAEKLKLETKLAAYRQKIEAAGDLHSQIQSLDKKCSALMTRAEKAEKLAARVPSLSSKLEEYKRAVAEAEVKASELAVKNHTQKAMLAKLRSTVEEMREAGNLREEEALDLASQLTVASEVGNAPVELTITATEGLTELNPEVMERVRRLEIENAALREKCDAEQSDKMDQLKEKCDDVVRLKNLFEGKYHDAAAARDRLSHELSSSKKEMCLIREELQTVLSAAEHTRLELKVTDEKLKEVTEAKTLLQEKLTNAKKIIEEKEAHAVDDQQAHEHEISELSTKFENTMHDYAEREQMKTEDLRGSFLLFAEKHSVSDAEHTEKIRQLCAELKDAKSELKMKSEEVDKKTLTIKEGQTKFKKMILKGKTMIALKDSKLKKGLQLVNSLQSKKKKMEARIAEMEQQIKLIGNDNEVLRVGGGGSAGSRSGRRLEKEFDNIMLELKKSTDENKKLKRKIKEVEAQMGAFEDRECDTLRKPRRRVSTRASEAAARKAFATSRKMKAESNRENAEDSGIFSLLEEENKKLKSEIQTISMLKAASIREQHQLEQQVTALQQRVKDLEDGLTHMRLKEERRVETFDEVGTGEKRLVLGQLSENATSREAARGKGRRKSKRISNCSQNTETIKEQDDNTILADGCSDDDGNVCEDDCTGPLDHEVLNNSHEQLGTSRGLRTGARRVTHAQQKSGIRAAAKRVARVKAGEVGVSHASAMEEDSTPECVSQ